MNAILLLDDDLGFIFWLGELLASARLSAIPATSVPKARRFLGSEVPRLVIVNFDLPGVADFVEELRHKGQLRIIAALPPGTDPARASPERVDVACPKPIHVDDSVGAEWLGAVARLLGGSMENAG